MTDETKQTLFSWCFAGATLFYGWAVISIWMGPRWGLSGARYMIVGVLPAFLGVVCTVLSLVLHIDLQDSDSTSRGGF
jgi:hypothetical protein